MKYTRTKDTKEHLCMTCKKNFPSCDASNDLIEFGDGVGNDNIIGCNAYEGSD